MEDIGLAGTVSNLWQLPGHMEMELRTEDSDLLVSKVPKTITRSQSTDRMKTYQ